MSKERYTGGLRLVHSLSSSPPADVQSNDKLEREFAGLNPEDAWRTLQEQVKQMLSSRKVELDSRLKLPRCRFSDDEKVTLLVLWLVLQYDAKSKTDEHAKRFAIRSPVLMLSIPHHLNVGMTLAEESLATALEQEGYDARITADLFPGRHAYDVCLQRHNSA